MAQTIPNTFRLYCIGPYDTRLITDHSMLATRHETYQRELIKILRSAPEFAGTQLKVEKFDHADGYAAQEFEAWLAQKPSQTHELTFDREGGRVRKDTSIVQVDLEEEFELLLKPDDVPQFVRPPTMKGLQLNVYEHGIGLVSCWIDVELVTVTNSSLIPLMEALKDAVVKHPQLIARMEQIDIQMQKAATILHRKLKLVPPVFQYEELLTGAANSAPLWAHSVSIFDVPYAENPEIQEGELPFGTQTYSLVNVSHPDGLIDMCPGGGGFVHIGWGVSLLVGASHEEECWALNALQRLEIDWYSAHIFNQLLCDRLDQYSQITSRDLKGVTQSLGWIDRVKMEVELYYANQANYLHMLAPYPHYIYTQSRLSWRMPEMKADSERKLRALEVFQTQGKQVLEKNIARQFNLIALIITFITLTSTVIDVLTFVFPSTDTEWSLVERILAASSGLISVFLIWLIVYFLTRLRK